MRKYKGFISLLLAGFIFGTFGIWIRILNLQMTTYQQIFFRGVVGFTFASFLVFIFKQKIKLNGVNKKILLAYAFCFPLAIIFFVLSLLNTKISVTIFSFYATGIIGSLFIGSFFFKEKFTWVKVGCLGLVVVGIFFLSYPLSLSTFSFGLMMGLIGGFLDAISNSLRKFVSGKIDRFVLVAMQMGGVIVVSLVLLFINRNAVIVPMTFETIFVGIVFGGLLMFVSLLTLIGFQNYDLNLGTIVLSSELIFAPVFAVLVFQEIPSVLEIVGGLFVASAIVVSNVNFRKK
jgi:drug/metabolite transporter (DMT)-like permease